MKFLKGRIRQNGVYESHQKVKHKKASDWVHALVLVVKPNGKLRVCLDPHTLRGVLQHNIHNAQRFVDIIAQIWDFTHCSKIDANSRFWTLPLDAMSQLLTTFDTPWGQSCFLKLPFGLCELHYFFQFYMDLNFKAINEGTYIIANDVLIVGSDSNRSTGSHDYHLLQVLNKCREIGLKLNPDKCIFNTSFVLQISSNQTWSQTTSQEGQCYYQQPRIRHNSSHLLDFVTIYHVMSHISLMCCLHSEL